MDIFPKFIIEDGNIIISKCTFHKDIVCNPENVRGGGWFMFNDGAFIFYGDSHEYGAASFDDIKNAVENDNVYTNPSCSHSITKKYKFFYGLDESVPLN